jgi:hypothetical protein
MVDFAGWEMPVQYAGVIDEHRAVRSAAGLFDVSHMGQIRVAGAGAQDFVQRLTPNDVAKLAPGRIHLSAFLPRSCCWSSTPRTRRTTSPGPRRSRTRASPSRTSRSAGR